MDKTAFQSELRVCLFGSLSITFNQQPISNQSESLQSLLAFLILKAQTPQSRSHLASLLWPETSDADAKTKLRRALYQLKQKFPFTDQYLGVKASTLQWNTQLPCWVDVAAFEQALSQAHATDDLQTKASLLKQAIALYSGDFLPQCEDEWMQPERDRLQTMQMNALQSLIEILMQQKQYQEAIAYSQKQLQLDPLMESGYLTLMQLHYGLGDRASALHVYHQCMTVLGEELGVDPSPTTRQLYEQLLREDSESTPDTPLAAVVASESSAQSDSPLVSGVQIDWGEAPDIQFFYGRGREMDTLRGWMARCRLITVLGMGGIGKTTLVAKVTHELQGSFNRVIWRSLRNAPPLESLLGELISFLSDQQDRACSLIRLMHWLRQSRCLLILDNFETLLNAKDRAGQFHATYRNYRELIEVIGQSNHQSCVVLTSREKPAEIASMETVNSAVQSIQLSGSPEAAIALLDAKSLIGTPAQKAELSAKYGHSPLALQIVGGSIRDVFSGDISLFLAEDTLLFNGAKKLLDVQFARLIPLERSVMFWLAINREWTSLKELMGDIHPRCSKSQLLEAIESLSWRSLIERRANTYTQQPVVMEYVTTMLLSEMAQELTDPQFFNGNDLRSAYLCNYALMKTTGADYIRESQERIIIQPLIEELGALNCDPQGIILNHLKTVHPLNTPNYAVGNLLNLGRSLKVDFTGIDLSHQLVRQAYLSDISLHHVNCSHTQFQQTIFNQPVGPIFDVAFNPNGNLLAVCEGDGQIEVWDLESFTLKLVLKETLAWLLAITFNYDGSRLVSEGDNRQLYVWDVDSGTCVQKLQGHHGDLIDLNYHPTENLIVSASADGKTCLWDLNTGGLRHEFQRSPTPVRAAAFSPDGTLMASGTEAGQLNLWDVSSGEPLHQWQCSASIMSLSFSADGQQIALGTHLGEIQYWAIATQSITQSFPAHDSMVKVKFSPCGRYLASGSYGESKLWDAKTGQLLRVSNDYRSWIWGLDFSPNGDYLAVGNHDHRVRLWELPQKRLLKLMPGRSSWVTALAFHPEQPLLASCSNNGTARLWNLETGITQAILEGHQDWIVGVDFSPCGHYVVTSSHDKTIRQWAVQTGQLLKTLEGHLGAAYGIRFSPDGSYLVSSGLDLSLRIWDMTTGSLQKVLERPDAESRHSWILSIQFSPTQPYFVTGGSDGVIDFWDAEVGKHQQSIPAHDQSMCWALSFHPSGEHLVSAGEDATVKVWDVKKARLITCLMDHTDTVYTVAFSPDGQWLATAGDDLTIKLWNAQTYTLVKSIEYHQSRITSLTFTPDSQYMASGSIDETIAIWKTAVDQPEMTLRAPRPYEGMNITHVHGLTDAQISALKALGADDHPSR